MKGDILYLDKWRGHWPPVRCENCGQRCVMYALDEGEGERTLLCPECACVQAGYSLDPLPPHEVLADRTDFESRPPNAKNPQKRVVY